MGEALATADYEVESVACDGDLSDRPSRGSSRAHVWSRRRKRPAKERTTADHTRDLSSMGLPCRRFRRRFSGFARAALLWVLVPHEYPALESSRGM